MQTTARLAICTLCALPVVSALAFVGLVTQWPPLLPLVRFVFSLN
jgi:hypothetical protein